MTEYLPSPLPPGLDSFSPGCTPLAELGAGGCALPACWPTALGGSRGASVPTLLSAGVLGVAACESCPNLLSLEGPGLRPTSALVSTVSSPVCAGAAAIGSVRALVLAGTSVAGLNIALSSATGTDTSSAVVQLLKWHLTAVCMVL